MKCYSCGVVDYLIDMGKHYACSKCISNGIHEKDWAEIEINMDDDVFVSLASMAMKDNVTINMLINKIFRDFINKNENLTPEELQEKFKTEGVKIEKNDTKT